MVEKIVRLALGDTSPAARLILTSEDGSPLGIRTSTTPYRGSHFACVDAETECLTLMGWLHHDQLCPGDQAPPAAHAESDGNTLDLFGGDS